MKRIMSFLQNLRIVRIVTVFLASSFLFLATACGSNSSLQAKGLDSKGLDTKAYPEQYVPKNAVTNPREGGMNQFSDVDPRANKAGVQEKASYLEKNAERNLEKRADTNTFAITVRVHPSAKELKTWVKISDLLLRK